MIIDDLVKGSIDMHCHHAPDALIEGRMDALETVKLARDMGMRAVVLKSTYFPTKTDGGYYREISAGSKSLRQCLSG